MVIFNSYVSLPEGFLMVMEMERIYLVQARGDLWESRCYSRVTNKNEAGPKGSYAKLRDMRGYQTICPDNSSIKSTTNEEHQNIQHSNWPCNATYEDILDGSKIYRIYLYSSP